MRKTKLLALLGLSLFVWVIWSAGPGIMLSQIAGADLFWISGVVSILVINIIIKSFRWLLISREYGYECGILNSIRIWLIGLAGATITPGRLGDFMKAVYMKQYGKIPLGSGISAVMIERITDVAVLFSLAGFGLVFTGSRLAGSQMSLPLIGMLIVAGFAGLWALTQKKVVRIVARPIFDRIIPQKYKQNLRGGFEDLYGSMFAVFKRPRFLTALVLLTYLSWLLTFASTIFSAKALGVDIPLIYVVAFAPLAVLMELLPITVGGFGTREATAVFLYGLIGLAASTTVAMTLIGVLISWVAVAAGFVIWLRRPVNMKGLLGG